MPVRMRFPAQALEELKQEDPGTQVTLHYLRSIARQGLIPCVQIGRRRLLNYDALLQFLAHTEQGTPEAVPGIRRIAEKE